MEFSIWEEISGWSQKCESKYMQKKESKIVIFITSISIRKPKYK